MTPHYTLTINLNTHSSFFSFFLSLFGFFFFLFEYVVISFIHIFYIRRFNNKIRTKNILEYIGKIHVNIRIYISNSMSKCTSSFLLPNRLSIFAFSFFLFLHCCNDINTCQVISIFLPFLMNSIIFIFLIFIS